ncbi:lipopolysaccharide biosynthesis protein [Psychrobacter sp. CCUG 69069]|uniref:lipopolysaccharide biosynthesis protein n=1 Tax=Psychrobacter sp. CCUG 69069 TaxID=2282777 RepID=UPI001E48028E|nr:lipopolysaccharide biosynthesis protein [Psychrobacter sp. CCUG 69069]MCD1279115.1 lipopolysaccharide biosynthesis protein [Psychrobacter sp. CCUG 69069]
MTPKKIAAFALGPIGGAALGLITLPIVAWFFSPDDIGRLSMLHVTLSFSILLFSLGLDQAYVREFHEVTDKPVLLKSVFLPGFVLLTIGIVILALMPWSMSVLLFGIDSKLLTGLLIVAILLQFSSRFLSLILRMQEKGFAYSMSQILPKLFFLSVLGCYFLFSVEAIFENLMIANLLSLSAVFLIYTWNTRKDWLAALTARIDKNKLKRMISFGLPLIGSGIAFWGLTAMDKFFIRGFSSFKELGIYSVAISFAALALVFQSVFSTVWAPIVYKWASEGLDPHKVKNITDYSTLAVISIWSLAGMFSWLVTYILPPKYDQVQYILLASMAHPLLYTLSEATGVGIGVKRKTAYAMLAALVALLLNAIGNWYLVPKHGAAGAAVASAFAFLAFFIVRTEVSARLWQSFERVRMYILVLCMVILSSAINFIEIKPISMFILYFMTLLSSIVLFNSQFKVLLSSILSLFKKSIKT